MSARRLAQVYSSLCSCPYVSHDPVCAMLPYDLDISHNVGTALSGTYGRLCAQQLRQMCAGHGKLLEASFSPCGTSCVQAGCCPLERWLAQSTHVLNAYHACRVSM